MADLGQIGFGLEPGERRKEQARFLAQAAMPLVKEAVQSVHDGKVAWNADRMDLAFQALDELSNQIDEAGFDEIDTLFLHGICTGIMKSRTSGMISDRKMQMILAICDTFVELYGVASEILELQVDR